jgi:hypothetical protein
MNMNVLIVARTELGPVEMFNLAVQHGATAILDVRRRPGPVPAALDHIYQHPPAWVLARFAERFFAHWPCSLTCDAQRAAVCECPYVLLLLTDDGETPAAVELVRRSRPQARSLDGLW